VHLIPAFGATRLGAITNEDIQRLKHRLRNRAPKTVNNVLTVLNVLLKKAVEWDVINQLPCTIRLCRSQRHQWASTTSMNTNDSSKRRRP
jgi:hypothetical protein